MQERILTPEQVSQILQVHPFTVLKFIKQGKLKASKLGRVYRIRQSDLEYFLDHTSGRASKTEPTTQENQVEVPITIKSKNKNKLFKKIDKTDQTTVDLTNKSETPPTTQPNHHGDDHYYILQ